MRTIERDIVGAFIFSSDNKVLLGNNKKGGVYQDQLVVPGGGIEEGESRPDALKREILEETGIDISDSIVTEIEGVSVGESEKTLRDLGERVLVKMNFHDFKVQLNSSSSQVALKFEDDFEAAKWYTSDDLAGLEMSPATKATLQKLRFI
jgi:8-oxo-dGTP pyrophosphatase MutT (NUDIX family)